MIDKLVDNPEYIELGDISIRRISLEGQTQYLSRYALPDDAIPEEAREEIRKSYPFLAEGLRFRDVDPDSYHDIKIHRDDAEEFVRRVNRYRIERGVSSPDRVDDNYLAKN